MVLNSQTLARLRAVVAHYLKETCTIQKLGNMRGQYGEVMADQWETVASNVPCRIITESVRWVAGELVGEQESLVETYRLIVPVGTALAANQRIIISGITYEVVNLVTGRTDETDEQAIITRARTN